MIRLRLDLLKRAHLAILGQLMMMTGCGPSHTVAKGLCWVTWISYYISPEYCDRSPQFSLQLSPDGQLTTVKARQIGFWSHIQHLTPFDQCDWLLSNHLLPSALHLSQWRSRRSHAWWWWRGGSLWWVGKVDRASVDESFCNRKRKFQNFTQAVGSFATQMVFYSLSFSSSRKPKTTEAIVLSIEL